MGRSLRPDRSTATTSLRPSCSTGSAPATAPTRHLRRRFLLLSGARAQCVRVTVPSDVGRPMKVTPALPALADTPSAATLCADSGLAACENPVIVAPNVKSTMLPIPIEIGGLNLNTILLDLDGVTVCAPAVMLTDLKMLGRVRLTVTELTASGNVEVLARVSTPALAT